MYRGRWCPRRAVRAAAVVRCSCALSSAQCRQRALRAAFRLRHCRPGDSVRPVRVRITLFHFFVPSANVRKTVEKSRIRQFPGKCNFPAIPKQTATARAHRGVRHVTTHATSWHVTTLRRGPHSRLSGGLPPRAAPRRRRKFLGAALVSRVACVAVAQLLRPAGAQGPPARALLQRGKGESKHAARHCLHLCHSL